MPASTQAMSADARQTGTTHYHHFTVDVEEHFQVSALEPHVERSAWDSLGSRVVGSTERLLDLLEGAGMRGTFFVLGWIAERHPGLVRDIARRGHEVASHGTDHKRVTFLTPDEFRVSVRDSKDILEHVTGAAVLGYRAPSFSIVKGREWALEILAEEGYAYDSSLFPIRRPGYGYAAAKRHPYKLQMEAGDLMEFPPTTLEVMGRRLPAAGGAYLRLLPPQLVASALRQAEESGQPGTLYIHPWEIDAEQPRFAVPMLTRIRHYGRLAHTYGRLAALCEQFTFRPIADTLRRMTAQ